MLGNVIPWNVQRDKAAFGKDVSPATSRWDVARDDSCHPIPDGWALETIAESNTGGQFLNTAAKLLGKAIAVERRNRADDDGAWRERDGGGCAASRNLLFDFGAAEFRTSVRGLMTAFAPMRFDHVFAFEANQGVFEIPPEYVEHSAGEGDTAHHAAGAISYFNAIVSDHVQPAGCDAAANAMPPPPGAPPSAAARAAHALAWANATRWGTPSGGGRGRRRRGGGGGAADAEGGRDDGGGDGGCRHYDAAGLLATLARPEDFVVVKIDIEGSEFLTSSLPALATIARLARRAAVT